MTAALLSAVVGSGVAEARVKPRIKVSPNTVAAGEQLTVRLSGTQHRRCTITLRAAVKGATPIVSTRTRGTRVKLTLPSTAAIGVNIARVKCGSKGASASFVVVAPVPSATADPVSEHLDLTDSLPEGVGNPDDYAVSGPANAGGAGFASYWPLPQGYAATFTEGPGGVFSHSTVYTRDAVDLGIGTGTEIRAGFNGVVARVSRGCVVGNKSCGSGYGNYVYLKAGDGTCAVMAHLSRVDVDPGDQIAQYALIGLSGTTGNSTGPHLHYSRLDCNNNRSLPWAPIEGGPLGDGARIVSQNRPVSGPTTTPTPTPTTAPPPPATWGETTGGVAHTWTNAGNAGGTEGPTIAAHQTVQIACRLQGFRVADGNTWWYRIASAPWNNRFYVSADAFYNNGQTSGSLVGTPFVDPAVANC